MQSAQLTGLSLAKTLAKIGYSGDFTDNGKNLNGKSVIYEMMQRDEFPRPIKIGRKSVWLAHEIDAWLSARAAERDGATRGGV